MIKNKRIGRGYRFHITGASEDIWVCFAQSENNPKIMRLAPAIPAIAIEVPKAESGRPDTANHAVKIIDTAGKDYQLMAGIEIGIHVIDLENTQEVSKVGVFKVSGEVWSFQGDEHASLVEKLTRSAILIENAFHEGVNELDYPSIEECQIANIDSQGRKAIFHWSYDAKRYYRLQAPHSHWVLTQSYDAIDRHPADLRLPLVIGGERCVFGEDGVATLTESMTQRVFEVFGLPFSSKPSSPINRVLPKGRIAINLSHFLPSAGSAWQSSSTDRNEVEWREPTTFTLRGGAIRARCTFSREGEQNTLEIVLKAKEPTTYRLVVRDPRSPSEPEREVVAELVRRESEWEPGVALALWRKRFSVPKDCVELDFQAEDEPMVLALVYQSPPSDSAR